MNADNKEAEQEAQATTPQTVTLFNTNLPNGAGTNAPKPSKKDTCGRCL